MTVDLIKFPWDVVDPETSAVSPDNYEATLPTPYAILPVVSFGSGVGNYMQYDISSVGLADGWIFVYIGGDGISGYQTSGQTIFALSGASSDLFRVIATSTDMTGSGTSKAQYWNGSSWTDIATLSASLNVANSVRLDIHVKLDGSAGVWELYVNGALEFSTTPGNTIHTADTTVDFFQLHSKYLHASSAMSSIGPIIVDSGDTRGLEMDYNYPSSIGTYNELSAGEANVDDHVSSGTAPSTSAVGDSDGERMTLNFEAINASLAGFAVEDVVTIVRAKAQADPGLFIKGMARIGGSDYTHATSSQPTAATDEQWHTFSYPADPSTGSAWADQAAVEACEFGVILSSTA